MTIAWLLLWGMIVGLDLISVPQVMVSRPLVAAVVAGAIVGDPAAGLTVGVMLELFALDVLPVGAVRYPDHGPAAVAGVAAAAGAPAVVGIGVAVVVGLVTGYLGQWSIVLARRRTSHLVRRAGAALDAGDVATVRRVHLAAIGRDAARAVTLTGVGLVLAALARRWPPVSLRTAVLLTAAMAGTALATAGLGALRLPERRRGLGWLAAGLIVGVGWVVVR